VQLLHALLSLLQRGQKPLRRLRTLLPVRLARLVRRVLRLRARLARLLDGLAELLLAGFGLLAALGLLRAGAGAVLGERRRSCDGEHQDDRGEEGEDSLDHGEVPP
jgi:hypothetical protein